MRSRNACWTCKARRVQCDGGLPACQKCVRGRRRCQGYAMRLSWPRHGDKRRAATCDLPSTLPPQKQTTDFSFINATWSDMELYHHVNSRLSAFASPSSSWKHQLHLSLNTGGLELLTHFHDSAYISLVTFDVENTRMRDSLITMALADGSAPGRALLYALLAFSAFHHSRFNQQAMQLKISALHFLSASAKEQPRTNTEAAQQVAASMLLGAFDMMLPWAGSGEWLWYVRGAMAIVEATRLTDKHGFNSDIGNLLNWVYYHNALSRFSLHHWQHGSLVRDGYEANHSDSQIHRYPLRQIYTPTLPCPNATYAILGLLSETCDTLLDPKDPRSSSQEYHETLELLDRRIGNVHLEALSAKSSPEDKLAVEVWQTATQIYLARASQESDVEPKSLDSLIDMAFAGPIRNCSCPHFFPLFILACEARADDRRTAILDLIARTEDIPGVRSRIWVRQMIQSIWVHQDRHSDGELLVNYTGAMNSVISMNNTVPSFV